MEFIEEKSTVLPSHKADLERIKRAVEAGWSTEQLARAFIHVRADGAGRDLFVFEIYDKVSGRATTLEFAPDEAAENVQRRTHDGLGQFLTSFE